jgi:hypothetical protein
MWMGGLRIFGTGRNVQKPTMMDRAAKVFAKYHERVLERMQQPKTRVGVLVNLMLAKRLHEEKTDVKKGLDELDGRLEGMRKRHHPVGVNQDAHGWFDRCGRPRYPMQ